MIAVTDEMVERAAAALHHKRHPTEEWAHQAEYMTKHHWREQARIALTAGLEVEP